MAKSIQAQDSTNLAAAYSPTIVWSALTVGVVVVILLVSGIIVQQRWKNKE